MLIQNINQLREGRGYINALVIFNALQTLTQNFFHNHSVFLQIRIILLQVQKQGNKRRLTIGGHQGIDLILNGLYATLQLVAQALICQTLQSFVINVASGGFLDALFKLFVALTQIFAKMTDINRLTAVLAGSNGCNNLCHNGAGNLVVCLINSKAGSHKAGGNQEFQTLERLGVCCLEFGEKSNIRNSQPDGQNFQKKGQHIGKRSKHKC